MTAAELINHMIPPLKLSDTTEMALNWMKEFRLDQLVVAENDIYKGIISEDILLEDNEKDKPISGYELEYPEIFALPKNHFYDVIKLANLHDLHVLAVVDEERKLLGIISINDTATTTAQLFASHDPGGILVLSLRHNDYSLSTISRLIEENEVKVLSSFVVTDERDPALLKLTLKLNKEDLSRVIATLERHQYTIIAQFHESEFLNNDKDRLDMLFRYLNI
ncbi:MAG: CBS domain-containing protein [Cytophagaceae bacterium]